MRRILQLVLTGLSTVPVDPFDPATPPADVAVVTSQEAAADCGMLLTAKVIRDAILIGPAFGHKIEAVGWDEYPSPDATCRHILQIIDEFMPDDVVVHAHSFGNSLLCFFGKWLAKWHPERRIGIRLVFGYDPCRVVFPPIFGRLDWVLDPALVGDVYSWYNTDPWRCFGVVGTPFKNRSYQTDVTAWEPKLAHVTAGAYTGIPQSPMVRKEVYAIVRQELGGEVGGAVGAEVMKTEGAAA